MLFPLLMMVIQYMCTGQEPAVLGELADVGPNSYFHKAIQAQNDLGWQYFLQGFVVCQWVDLQEYYAKTNKDSMELTNWVHDFVTALQDYCTGMWKVRNTMIHGVTAEESRKI